MVQLAVWKWRTTDWDAWTFRHLADVALIEMRWLLEPNSWNPTYRRLGRFDAANFATKIRMACEAVVPGDLVSIAVHENPKEPRPNWIFIDIPESCSALVPTIVDRIQELTFAHGLFLYDPTFEERRLKSPISSTFGAGIGCCVVALAVGIGLTALLSGGSGPAVVGGAFIGLLLGLLYSLGVGFERRAACPACGEMLRFHKWNSVAWCGTCKDYYRPAGRWLMELPLSYVDPKYVFAVSFGESSAPPELWSWPDVCPACGSAATNKNVISGRILVGAAALGSNLTRIQYRNVSFPIPRCDDAGHCGVYFPAGDATKLLFCSYGYWRSLVRINGGVVQPEAADAN